MMCECCKEISYQTGRLLDYEAFMTLPAIVYEFDFDDYLFEFGINAALRCIGIEARSKDGKASEYRNVAISFCPMCGRDLRGDA